MAEYETREFTRHGEDERSIAYTTAGSNAATLAYLDTYRDGTAAAVVYDPATGRSHTYGRRPADRARAIIDRHLARNGYTESI